ncbi:MAG: hypothetical protein R3D27_00935 [Hyphomicrobiaceae bacterium]
MRARSSKIIQSSFARPVPAELPTAAPAAESDDATRRFAARRASAMSGGILVDAVSPPIPCTIRNTSSTGALLELKASLGSWSHAASDLPDEFVLVLTADNLEFDCMVARRCGRQVGVRFAGPGRLMQRAQSAGAARPGPARPARPTLRGAVSSFGRRG